MIEYCKEQYQEERIWQMYLAILPNMDEQSYVNYNDYKKNILEPKKPEPVQPVAKEATPRKQGEIDPRLLAMATRFKEADLKGRVKS